MAKLISTEEIIENGIEYIVEHYESGARVKKLKPQPLPDDYVAPEPEPTQLDNIEDTQTTLMLALAEQYEKQLALEENQNTIMLALADIYESQLN